MYDDLEEPVTFSDHEWEVMENDPVYFGLACNNGHACREDDPDFQALGCPTCFWLGEQSEYLETDEDHARFEAFAAKYVVYPVLDCPHCESTHVGTGAIERCADYKARGVRLRRR